MIERLLRYRSLSLPGQDYNLGPSAEQAEPLCSIYPFGVLEVPEPLLVLGRPALITAVHVPRTSHRTSMPYNWMVITNGKACDKPPMHLIQ